MILWRKGFLNRLNTMLTISKFSVIAPRVCGDLKFIVLAQDKQISYAMQFLLRILKVATLTG